MQMRYHPNFITNRSDCKICKQMFKICLPRTLSKIEKSWQPGYMIITDFQRCAGALLRTTGQASTITKPSKFIIFRRKVPPHPAACRPALSLPPSALPTVQRSPCRSAHPPARPLALIDSRLDLAPPRRGRRRPSRRPRPARRLSSRRFDPPRRPASASPLLAAAPSTRR